MKIEKRYIVIALFIAFALSIDMSLRGVLAFIILASTFYGFHLIAKQSRLDDKKLKQTKNEPTVQKLLKAKQSQDLINWQFESIEYLERNKIEPSAIKILVKNQQPIILEQNFLTSEIHTTMEVLKNYWYLCAKGYPLPKIT